LKAELRVDINQGTLAPVPIALPQFFFQSGSGDHFKKFATQIPEVVGNDLKNSGLFRLVDSRSFIQNANDVDFTPRFADWRILQAQVLVTGKIIPIDGDRFKVEFRLFDVFAEKQIEGLSFVANEKDWRRIAHKIADSIYKRVTGEEGYFDTRIVYIAETKQKKGVLTRLAIMDQDGANHRYLTDNKRLILTPRFSPNLQLITFMDYGHDSKTPRVYIMDTKSGKRRMLGNFKGMTFAPRFAPDGETVVLSLSEHGDSDIYIMNLRTGQTRQITRGPAIDTSASFSPDGNQIVFNSDRGGSQQLYVMNTDGTNIRRISYGQGRYATPVWSPRGDLIAFTKMTGGDFYIGVMRTDGSGERLLSRGYLVEEPSWSPNGRVLVFNRGNSLRDNRQAGIYMVDITGYNERKIPTPVGEEAVSAAWSPLLP
jgi:TolB protein